MEKEECSICCFQYDKINKVPRVLRCGHTFCQTCLDEIKGGPLKKPAFSNTITCPNCRIQTENVICAKNLPENEVIFQPIIGNGGGSGRLGHSLHMLSGTNILNSPYEGAKRLQRESNNLAATGERFVTYLNQMQQLVSEAETLILTSYEQEHGKIGQIADIMVSIIKDYQATLQSRLTSSMV